jgi:hypothetical protein
MDCIRLRYVRIFIGLIVGLNVVAIVLLSIGGIDRLNTICKDK